MGDLPTLPDLEQANAALDGAAPEAVLAWAVEHLAPDLVATASFSDAVLAHLVTTAAPGTEIVLLDTQYLFAETLWYADHLRKRLRLDLRIERPALGVVPDDRWQHDLDGCCHARKVEPLERILAGRRGWITGVRRADAATRRDTPVVHWDERRNVVKVNPLAALSDDEVAAYLERHALPSHPLSDRGYPSIGCWPCTWPVAPGEDPRSGRWAGTGKVECGLHR